MKCSPPRRALLARALVFVLPLPLAAGAAAFAGCTDLVDQQTDAGGGAPVVFGDDGAAIDQVPDTSTGIGGDDAAGDATGDDASDGAVDCGAEQGDASFGAPNDLQCTGLYSDFAAKTIDAKVQPFDPGLHLWSDGADKHRWVLIPAGTKIDTTDMNEWRFPIGTKFWKEFRISGHRVETRMFWKRGENDWVRGTYVWSADESSATYLATGETNVAGTSYEIPTIEQCDTCHMGRIDHILGFEAVSLSQPSSSGLNMSALVAQGLLTAAPASSLAIPDDGTGRGAKALGWLHANCGTACHNDGPSSFAGATGLWMRLEVGSDGTLGAYVDTATYKTAVNVTPLLAPYASEGWKRIKPGDPFVGEGLSLIPFRDGKRNEAGLQMPPIGSSIPDLADVAVVRDWIQNGSFPQ